MTSKYISGNITIDRLLAFVFGLIFVSVMLVLAVKYPEPSVRTWFIFKVVLALVAGGIGAMIPGSLEVNFKWAKAVGASAFFLIVLVFPVETAVAKFPEPPSMDKAIELSKDLFLALEDNTLYDKMSPYSRKLYSRKAWDLSFSNAVAPLGKAISRSYMGSNQARVLWQTPQGDYLTLNFRTTFQNSTKPIFETLSFFSDDGKTWVPVGYQISPHDVGAVGSEK